MPAVYVALGSNIEPVAQLRHAALLLRARFPDVRFSSCFRNAAVGFEGDDFYNAVAGFSTDLPLAALLGQLRRIEAACGRPRAAPKWGPRAMDLDLLLYGSEVGAGSGYALPRPDLTRRAYMLGPLAQLAPEQLYPPDGPRIAELWAAFPRDAHPLTAVDLDLNAVRT